MILCILCIYSIHQQSVNCVKLGLTFEIYDFPNEPENELIKSLNIEQ